MRDVILSLQMQSKTRSPLCGRPTKRKRSGAELHDLSRALGADWTPGDTVQTWLHKHEGKAGELSRMVEEGWSWEDLGKAMHLAGISYRTGELISANTLRHKAYLARNRERDRLAAEAARQTVSGTPPSVPSVAITVAATTMQPPALPVASSAQTAPDLHVDEDAARTEPEEPMFRLVTLKGGQQPPRPKPSPPTLQHEQSATAKVSDDEILRRVFGKP